MHKSGIKKGEPDGFRTWVSAASVALATGFFGSRLQPNNLKAVEQTRLREFVTRGGHARFEVTANSVPYNRFRRFEQKAHFKLALLRNKYCEPRSRGRATAKWSRRFCGRGSSKSYSAFRRLLSPWE